MSGFLSSSDLKDKSHPKQLVEEMKAIALSAIQFTEKNLPFGSSNLPEGITVINKIFPLLEKDRYLLAALRGTFLEKKSCYFTGHQSN